MAPATDREAQQKLTKTSRKSIKHAQYVRVNKKCNIELLPWATMGSKLRGVGATSENWRRSEARTKAEYAISDVWENT